MNKILVMSVVSVLGAAAAAVAAAPTTAHAQLVGTGGGPGGYDSGGDDWGRYEVTASDPVTPLVRIGAHHARQWYSNPGNDPYIQFDISTLADGSDIAEMGLEIKADYVPGYYISARVCARSGGNVGGLDGADDMLTISGASSYPEVRVATFDPSGAGTCKTVNVYHPLEAGADEYTLMVRPLLQLVQHTYWQYTIYGKVIVEYHPLLR